MPKFPPAPESVVTFFNSVAASVPNVELRKMFGYPCAFVNGQMLTGVFGDQIMMRLGEADRTKFLTIPGATPFEPMPGRPMREYVVLPAPFMKSPGKYKEWLMRGHAYVVALPPKIKKGKKVPVPKKKAK